MSARPPADVLRAIARLFQAYRCDPTLELEGSVCTVSDQGAFRTGMRREDFERLRNAMLNSSNKHWKSKKFSHFIDVFYENEVRGRFQQKVKPAFIKKNAGRSRGRVMRRSRERVPPFSEEGNASAKERSVLSSDLLPHSAAPDLRVQGLELRDIEGAERQDQVYGVRRESGVGGRAGAEGSRCLPKGEQRRVGSTELVHEDAGPPGQVRRGGERAADASDADFFAEFDWSHFAECEPPVNDEGKRKKKKKKKSRRLVRRAEPELLADVLRLTDDPNAACKFYYHGSKCRVSVNLVFVRSVLEPKALKRDAKRAYDYILKACPTDEDVLRIKSLIDRAEFSGRVIDTFVTQYVEAHNVCYFVDGSGRIVNGRTLGQRASRINVFESYRNHMSRFSKPFFDCFGRGDNVAHTLRSGEKVVLSLCKFPFYIWADRFAVFDYLRLVLPNLVAMRTRMKSQTKKTKKEKKKKGKKRKSSSLASKSGAMHGKALTAPPIAVHHRDKRIFREPIVISTRRNKKIK